MFLLGILLFLASSRAWSAPPGREIQREIANQLRRSIKLSNLATGPRWVSRNASETEEADDEEELLHLPRFLNLWQQERKQAINRGLEYYLETSGEYFHTLEDPNGNNNRSYYHDLYLSASVDLPKARIARHGTVFLALVAGWEKTFSSRSEAPATGKTGGPETTSPGSGNSFQLYEFWYEQKVGRSLWLAGLRDLTGDFYSSRFNDALGNGGFWFGTDVSENAPLSIYDVTTLGIRCQYTLSDRYRLLAGIFEGSPGDSTRNPHGLGWHIGPSEGSFRIFEFQVDNPLQTASLTGKLKLGTWRHSGSFDDLRNVDDEENPLPLRNNWGNYFVFDQKLSNTRSDQDLGVGFFCHGGGQGPTDRSPVESYLGAGISLTGTFRGRDEDILSLGVNRKNYSTALREFNQINEESFLTREEVFEIAYQYKIRPGLTIKPDLQIIRNAEGDPSKPRSRFFSLRCTAIF